MDELAEVSKAVTEVFKDYSLKYPDRLRYDTVEKLLEWKDAGGNWNRVTDWDNF